MPAEIDDLEQASAMVAKVAWGNEPAVAVGVAIEAMSRSRNREVAGCPSGCEESADESSESGNRKSSRGTLVRDLDLSAGGRIASWLHGRVFIRRAL